MSRGNVMLLIIIGILLLIITFGIGFLVVSAKQSNNMQPEEQLKPLYNLEKSKMYSVGESIVSNLNTGDPKDKRIVRVKIHLRIADEKTVNLLQRQNAVITDTVISILRSKTPDEMVKPEANEIIKKQIIEYLNKCFKTDKIMDLYFEEFIVQ